MEAADDLQSNKNDPPAAERLTSAAIFSRSWDALLAYCRHDLGGMSRTYCKGELRAHLHYAGERANYGWDFDFNMSWGLDPLFGGPS